MKLGVFGGTFDPPHIGHLIAAQELHERLALDRLLLVPAGIPPHKRDEAVTPGAIRREMLRAAVGDDARFEVSELELERDGPSYTVDTVRALRSEHPGAELFVALGADQIEQLGTWKEPDVIAELATLVTFGRSGRSPDEARWPVRTVDVPVVGVSSTELRERVAAGRPVRYLVAPGVEAIIRGEGLYVGG